MNTRGHYPVSKAFALPTILIASIVLLTVLALSVTATATVRTALKNQYYVQLAQVAGESGVAYAKACLAANSNVPQWTDVKPLTPATDCSGNVIISPNVKALVVAGGGSGGGSTAGGGGAGGLNYSETVPIGIANFPIEVGAGGAGVGQQTQGNIGGTSSFATLVTNGGGGGGATSPAPANFPGLSGGSGGGGVNYFSTIAAGTGTAGQGNSGGGGVSPYGGGGGGAGGPGDPSAAAGGAGGIGLQYNITGSMVTYAAGGGGAQNGPGGSGIGGNATATVGSAAAANTGSGGGGGWSHTGGSGGAGGSGVVIIAYPTNSGIVATGGTMTTSGGNQIHRFTAPGTFAVTSAGSASCPTDPRCSVTINGNVRSSFTVPKPTVDGSGRALTIPNNGYVEVTRTSTGTVWRTYKQPSVQAAVVPDLCSGNATATRGWSAAVKATQQDALPSATTAQTISIATGALNAGTVYYRKDFNVGRSATYALNVYTPSAQDASTTFIDGQPVGSAAGSVGTSEVALTAGCHVMVVKLVNQTVVPRVSDFTASLTLKGAATPILVSDTSWRATAGDTVHFSDNNYFEAPTAWEQSAVLGIWNNPNLPWAGTPTNWTSVSGDTLAQWITTQFSIGGSNRPANSYALFRDTTPFTTTVPTTVRVTNYCDNECDLYLDGVQIMAPAADSGIVSKVIDVQPGKHTFAVRLFNGAAADTSAFLFAAYDTVTSTVLARSNLNWDTTTAWTTSAAEVYSYDATYKPTPAVQVSSNASVLVVGGGGGGGSDMGSGGGGGGVVSNSAFALESGNTYTVTVGSGGAGAPAGNSQVRGFSGANSRFGSILAYGGGGGGSEYANNGSPPGPGASAGGSAGSNQTLQAAPVLSQGFGSATTIGIYYPTGGGGAGGPGAVNPANGGIGVASSILGTSYFFGGGGGGSGYSGNGGNGGNGGGGGGAIGTTTGGAGLNSGAAGGGGTIVTQANRPGGNAGGNTGGGGGGGSHYNLTNNGGNGGTGIVVIAVPTGSMSITTSNVPSISTSGGFTIYRFNASGTFTVTSIN